MEQVGGSLASLNGKMNLTGGVLRMNRASVGGGGLAQVRGSLRLEDASFSYNTVPARSKSGANLDISRVVSVDVSSSQFVPWTPTAVVSAGSEPITCNVNRACRPGFGCKVINSSRICTACGEGLASIRGVDCKACKQGFKPHPNKDSCVECPDGMYSDTGATCTKCPTKTMSNNNTRRDIEVTEGPAEVLGHYTVGSYVTKHKGKLMCVLGVWTLWDFTIIITDGHSIMNHGHLIISARRCDHVIS